MAESYTRLRSRLLNNTYLMILSILRSFSIRKSASVNTCFCSVQMISRLDSQSNFHMLTLFSGRHFWWLTPVHQHGVFILESVNFCEAFRQISLVWGNAQAQNFEKCFLYLSPIISQCLDFFNVIVCRNGEHHSLTLRG